MEFKKAVLASFLALSLVACGDSSDNKDKPDDDPNKIPEKSQECVEAGDKCVLENGQWVIKKEPKPDDEPPVVEGSFDYSDIGVTDILKPERRGFSFYHKGENSKLDKEQFDTAPTLSSTISWSSDKKYDQDLFNFVAIRVHDGEKSSKGKPKFVFDKIGVKNHEQQLNKDFFGTAGVASAAFELGKSAFDSSSSSYMPNRIPALVNTYMFVDNDGKPQRVYSDNTKKIWYHDEADKQTVANGGGSGQQSSRVYGRHAFLTSKKNETLIPDPTNIVALNPMTGDEHKFTLKSRPNSYKDQAKHINFVWYKPSDRLARAKVNDAGTSVISAVSEYASGANRKKFPTDVEFGVLNDVQFGRLTGQGINPDAAHIPEYDPDVKLYPFAPDATAVNAVAGNTKAEDWYFARGTVPTPLSVLEGFKEAGQPVVYDGMAVMFGLDYNPMKTQKKGDKEELTDDKSTNSVMPKDDSDDLKTLDTAVLDGKQNFVRLIWDPASGHLNGGVYGVWTIAQYYRAKKTVGSGSTLVTQGNVVALKNSGFEVVADIEDPAGGKDGGAVPTGKTDYGNAANVIENATRIGVHKVNLVELKGKVVEETNSFGGLAIRCRDGDKGMFSGGFFGKSGMEIAGVINSQTGNMKDRNMNDPANKWGGAFGAQRHVEAAQTLEYLDFPDDPGFNYDTATEVF